MSIGVEDSGSSASGGFVGGVVGLFVVDPLGVDVIGVVLFVGVVINKIKNIIVFIDDVIIRTTSHEHHLEVLDHVPQRVEHHNLKIK